MFEQLKEFVKVHFNLNINIHQPININYKCNTISSPVDYNEKTNSLSFNLTKVQGAILLNKEHKN
jgi:hypothetical protein